MAQENKKKHNIFDNHKRGFLQEFLRDNVDDNSKCSFVSAYFTIYAYYALKDQFDKIDNLRFLFGEPEFIKKVSESLHYKNAEIDGDELTIPLDEKIKQSKIAKACAEWIKNKVEIKSIKRPGFLHGKTYIVENNDRRSIQAVIGSSNFTYKGIGCGKTPNMELNLRCSDERDVAEVASWFDEMWNDTDKVKDVKDEVLQSIEQLYQENTPEFIYFKTLYHVFDEFIDDERNDKFATENKHLFDSQIWNLLYDFQKDAVRGIINRIDKFGGCILADGVGLGKTFEALAVIKHYANKGQRVLVICPKKLQENWNQYRYSYNNNVLVGDNFHYTVLAHTDLSRYTGLAGDLDLARFAWEGFDLIVIDESHNFRNDKKTTRNSDGDERYTRYGRLMDEVLKRGVKSKVLLLTATPVNNQLSDLTSQINLITKEDNLNLTNSLNINGLIYIMRTAQGNFNDWTESRNDPTQEKKSLSSVMDNEFFKLLDNISIARSRKHIIAKYQKTLDKIGNFPTKQAPISVSTEIDTKDEFPNYDTLYKQIEKFKLHLYKPAQYVNKEFHEEYDIKYKRKEQFGNQATSEKFLTMMMRVNYLKRLESSIDSFRLSAFRTIEKYDATIAKFEAFIDPENQDELNQLDLELDFNELDEDRQEELEDHLTMGKKLKYRLKHFDKDKYLSALKNDREVLKKIYDKSVIVTPDRDAKLQKIKELITEKIVAKKNKGNKKVLIFTAFADTAKYLYDNLHQWVKDTHFVHSALILGGSSNNRTTLKSTSGGLISRYEDILINFSPIAKNRATCSDCPTDQIDILIATDCISEGQNLQDCDYLINYDIHWNPVRIIQRFGRIDRIGSQNTTIQMVNFWPTDNLDKYINLKNRVESRMMLVDLAGPGAETILNEEEAKAEAEAKAADKNDYRLRLLEKLKSETITSEDEDDSSFSITEFSLQDFRVDLTNFMESNRDKLEKAPLGLYAIVPPLSSKLSRVDKNLFNYKLEALIQPGVIFCLKHNNISKTNQGKLDKINPISPYYLVYVRNSGDIRFNFTNSKQILEIYNLLCKGETQIYETLCDIFNNELELPETLTNYTELLSKSCEAIMEKVTSRNATQVAQQRDAILIDQQVTINYLKDFELISWLIIKEGEQND